MAIVYGTVTIVKTSMTLREMNYVTVILASAPTGTAYGNVLVNGESFTLEHQAGLRYRAKLWGSKVRRTNGATAVQVVMWDTAGSVVYGTPINLTVTTSTQPFIPQPLDWVADLLALNWDTNFHATPTIEYQNKIKTRASTQLRHIHITLIEDRVKVKARGRGQYFDGQYPVEIQVRSEGNGASEDLCREGMAEVMRIIETYWNYIGAEEFDFIEYDDNTYNNSMEWAGKFMYVWRIRLMGVIRGRAGTPDTPLIP